MCTELLNALEENPVIAAVKDDAGLERCLQCESIRVVFILYGTICDIPQIVRRVKQAGKFALVHLDLIVGLARETVAVDYIRQTTEADGIISTRQPFIRRAQELDLCAVLRVFLLDSIALAGLARIDALKPDFIDVLPGTMPKTIHKVCCMVSAPVLAGGLISDKEDVLAALNAGAVAISTTNQEVWRM